MDAGKLRTFDPAALLRRPDAAAAQAGTPRFDTAAFTTQALLDLASEASAGSSTPTPAGTPPPSATPAPAGPSAPTGSGAEAQAATRAGLIVSLSERALDSAATARLLTDILTPADYSHLRPGMPPPNRAAEQAALEQARMQPFPRLPMTREVEEQAPRRPAERNERAAAGAAATRLAGQAERPAPWDNVQGREGLRMPADRNERLAAASAPTLLPPQGEGREGGGVRQTAPTIQPDPFATALQAAAGASAAAQAQRIAPPPQAEPLQPRPVPEMLAQFFSRSEAQPRTRWSLGTLLLAAAAIAIVALLVL